MIYTKKNSLPMIQLYSTWTWWFTLHEIDDFGCIQTNTFIPFFNRKKEWTKKCAYRLGWWWSKWDHNTYIQDQFNL